MKKNLSNTLVVIAVFIFLTGSFAHAQSDGCSFATTISVGAIGSCTLTHGTTVGATQTIPGCSGTADDDVWYQFTASSASMVIKVNGNTGFDPVLQVFSGACSVLQSMGCVDNTALGGSETFSATNFTIGNTYRIRIYSWGSGVSAEGDFDICVSEAATPPSNDDCAGATSLSVNSTCNFQQFDNSGATQSMIGCAGTADDDVWFKFTATNSVQTITVDPSTVGTGLMDPVVELFQGSCGSLTQISCNDNTGVGQAEVINAVGLIPGQTYYFRVYDYYSNWYDSFNVCVKGTPTPAPTNDEICDAIQLPTVTSACEYLTFNNVGATPSVGPPNPYIMSSTCETGSSTGYNPSSTGDVWFAITVPASGDLYITAQPNIGAGALSDGAMVLYTGSCSSPGSLTQVAYSNDYSCYPNSSPTAPYMPYMPFISATGLTPGSTVYLRYYNWGSSSKGTFGICVSTAENDNCSNALYICDINGYKGSTGTYYTADRPDNMHGNNETQAGVNQPDGTNTGGPFGYYPPSNIAGPYSSPSIDVNIDNNSWIRFTASASTVILNVDVYDCFNGNYPSGGIQMQIFSSNGCTNFAPVSSFDENSSGFSITASGLTAGQDYLLMIDGFAGDICSYTISANTGVQFPNIPDPAPVCSGDPVTLTAPASATSYQWDNGATTQSITLYPGASRDISCVVTGLCNHKQTLTAHITVKSSPILSFNTGSNPSICSGDPLTISAAGASTYSWNTTPTQSGSTITVSPSSNQSYTVTGNTSGCTATKTINVTVNPKPTVSTGADKTICDGESVTLSASGASSYSWNNGAGSGASPSVSPSGTTIYTVTGTNSNGCTNTATQKVTVKAKPNVNTGADKTICNGESVNLSASGASSYAWNNGAGSGATPSVSPSTTTTYTVTGTTNGCTNTATQKVTVKAKPNVTTGANKTICDGESVSLSASGASSYSWNNGAGSGPSPSVSPSTTTTYTVTGTTSGCTNTATQKVTVNPKPNVTTGADKTICDGESVSLSASGASSYSWNNGAGSGATPSVSPSTTTTYTVTGTTNGCTNTTTQKVTVNPKPNITTGADKTICNGESVTLSANGATSYSWNYGLGTGASHSVSPTSTTTYTVTGTDGNGCTNTATQKVTVHALPTVTVAGSTDPAACGQDGSIHLTFTHVPNGTYTITYSTGSFTNVTVYGADATINAPAGTYNDIHITNSSGCTSTDLPDVSLSDPSAPTTEASVAQNSICSGDDIHLSATTVSGATYTWTGPNGYSSNDQNPTISSAGTAANGTYSLTVNKAGCTGTDNVAVTVNPLPTLSLTASDSTICMGESTLLNASGAATYSWDNGIGNGASPTVSPTNKTTYIVTATDSNGCITNDSITIDVNKLPTVTATGGSYCEGDTAELSGTSAVSYAWSGPDNFISSVQNPAIQDFSSAKAGIYTLIITDQNGCKNSDTAKIALDVLSGLTISASDNKVCVGKDIILTANGADSYSWTGPNGFSSSGNPIHLTDMNADKSGTYYVIGTNAADCSAADTIVIGIEISGECLFIPQLITPNADHKNDKWVITGLEAFPKAEVEIFNRWGNIVFHASPYKNDWAGQVNKGLDVGKGLLPSATYFFILKLNNGKDKDIKGYIELQY